MKSISLKQLRLLVLSFFHQLQVLYWYHYLLPNLLCLQKIDSCYHQINCCCHMPNQPHLWKYLIVRQALLEQSHFFSWLQVQIYLSFSLPCLSSSFSFYLLCPSCLVKKNYRLSQQHSFRKKQLLERVILEKPDCLPCLNYLVFVRGILESQYQP